MKRILPFLFLMVCTVLNGNTQIIRNAGQLTDLQEGSDKIIAYADCGNYTVYFRAHGVSYVCQKKLSSNGNEHVFDKIVRHRMDMDYVGQSPSTETTFSLQQYPVVYYRNESKVQSFAYEELVYKNVWYDVDFHFKIQNGKLKYDIKVGPHADPEAVKFIWNGAKALSISENQLKVVTSMGELTERIPAAYLTNKTPVQVSYNVNGDTVGLNWESQKQGLIIDPLASYAGGSGVDEAFGVTADRFGNVYTCGSTTSADFPVNPGALDTSKAGFTDAFVFKFDNAGNRKWATYYGGSGDDYGYKLKMRNWNKVVVAGYSTSTDLNVSPSGVHQSQNNGSYDAFILELDSSGGFNWATYFGGAMGEFVLAMDLDRKGNSIIGGFTNSTDLPVSSASAQGTMNGALDGFIAKIDSTGQLDWCSYYGGSNSEDVHSVYCDAQDRIVFCGETYSSDWPASTNAYQKNNQGQLDAYLVRLDDQGKLEFATMFGGSGNEDFSAVYVNAQMDIYTTGYSMSMDFPIIGTSVHQPTLAGNRDAILVKFDSAGTPMKSTYFGGGDIDEGSALEGCGDHKLFVGGHSRSSNLFTTPGAAQDSLSGAQDIFFIKSDSALNINYATYLGGKSGEQPYHLCRSNNMLWMAGTTESSDFPYIGGFQTGYGGQGDAFVLRLDSVGCNITGVSQNEDVEVMVFPNPTSGKVWVCGDGRNLITEIQLFSTQGKRIKSYARINASSFVIDLGELDMTGPIMMLVKQGNGQTKISRILKF